MLTHRQKTGEHSRGPRAVRGRLDELCSSRGGGQSPPLNDGLLKRFLNDLDEA
jgi:hypothetical protein